MGLNPPEPDAWFPSSVVVGVSKDADADVKSSHRGPAANTRPIDGLTASIVRSPQKQKLFRRLPLERLCVESDAPVLGVDKGARNEPSAARVAAETIAELKGVSLEEVAEVTTRNAEVLFGS